MTDYTAKSSRKLTDAERAARNAALIADAPNMTVRELQKKYGMGFTGVGYVLRCAGVKAKSGRGVGSKKGEKKKWKVRVVRPKDATHLTCSRCGEHKEVAAFYEKGMVCRACFVAKANEWGKQNPEKVKAAKDKWAEENWERVLEAGKRRRDANPEKERERRRKYYAKNKKALMRKSHEWQIKELKRNLEFRIKLTLRGRIWRLMKMCKGKKCAKTEELIGMRHADFLAHIQSLWLPGMTWGNYGRRGWHIDHIIPCAAFDLTRPDHQRKCFHWSNMRPLWETDNLRKSKKIPVDCVI